MLQLSLFVLRFLKRGTSMEAVELRTLDEVKSQWGMISLLTKQYKRPLSMRNNPCETATEYIFWRRNDVPSVDVQRLEIPDIMTYVYVPF